jgi:DNA replication protein DnaC
MQLLFPDNFEYAAPQITDFLKEDLAKITKPFHYLFLGNVGAGKTHLCDIIIDNFEKQIKNPSKWIRWVNTTMYADYLNIFRDKSHNPYQDKTYLQANLFIDDLGDEFPATDAAKAFTQNLLMRRYMFIKEKKAKATLITSNLSLEAMQKAYGDRVFDRLLEVFTVFVFKNESFRKKHAKIIGL